MLVLIAGVSAEGSKEHATFVVLDFVVERVGMILAMGVMDQLGLVLIIIYVRRVSKANCVNFIICPLSDQNLE